VIIFLHGPNSFHSRQKLNALIEQFKKTRDLNGDNIVFLAGENLTIDELNSKIASQSLLAEKRLVIINDLFNGKKEEIFKHLLEYLNELEKNSDNSIIFYENQELDSKKFGAKKLTVARKKVFDFLHKQKYSEKFEKLNNTQTANWVKKNLLGKGITANIADLNFLAAMLENDQWAINNETNKLINFCEAQNKKFLAREDINLLSRANIDDNIFNLTDAISNNDKQAFFSLLEGQLEAGASEQQILSMLVRQFKIILQIKELLLMQKNQNEIALEIKQHPFVIKKTIPQTRNFNMENLKKIISDLIEIDYKIKIGQADGLTNLNLLFIN